MKKWMFISCLLLLSIGARAQFEQGKWLVNPSITGLNLSYNSLEKTTFGFKAQGGAFLIDNVALLVKLGANWTNAVDTYTVGVGGRYYFDSTGVYVGSGLNMNRWDVDGGNATTNFSLEVEAGYAFFITKTVTIEPAVYYDLSFKDSDYSRFGLKVGFGIYF